MLTIQETSCINCNKSQNTKIICRVGKDGLVRFFVECDSCGCYSHQLEYNEINVAVRHMLLANGYIERKKHRESIKETNSVARSRLDH